GADESGAQLVAEDTRLPRLPLVGVARRRGCEEQTDARIARERGCGLERPVDCPPLPARPAPERERVGAASVDDDVGALGASASTDALAHVARHDAVILERQIASPFLLPAVAREDEQKFGLEAALPGARDLTRDRCNTGVQLATHGVMRFGRCLR